MAARILGVERGWLVDGSSRNVRPKARDSLAAGNWHFREAPRDGGQDFGNANVFATPPDLETLVRETGQNTIDASEPPGSSIHLRYSLIRLSNGSSAFKSFLDAMRFEDLRSHIRAAGQTHSRLGTRLNAGLARLGMEEALFLLRVEDFGTTGLYGEEKKSTETPNPFAALIRNNMDSSKGSTTATGSFGLGKAVLWRCSELSTVLIASDIASPRRAPHQVGVRVVGKSELTWHTTDEDNFAGPGWFGRDSDSLWLDPSELAPLQLSRESRPENVSGERSSGTSILIVAFRDPKADAGSNPELLIKNLSKHIAVNFWPTMMRGQLSASVQYIADGEVKEDQWVDPYQHVPQFCEMLSRHAEDHVVDELQEAGDVLRRPVALSVPPTIPGASSLVKHFEEPHEAICHLLVRLADSEEDDDDRSGRVALVRGRGMVVRYWDRRDIVVGARRFHAVLLAGEFAGRDTADFAADQFLRLSEPPAHNRWDFNEDLRENFQRGSGARLKEFEREITEALRSAIRPSDTAQDDGPEPLRQLLRLQVRPERPKPPATLRRIEHEIVEDRWHITASVHMNDKSKRYLVTPRLFLDVESGSSVGLPWEHLKITGAGRGHASVTEDLDLLIGPKTSRVDFEATSASRALGVDAALCRVKLTVHAEERKSE